MREDYIRQLLRDVKEGAVSEEDAYEQLKELPYKEMDFANLDNHRRIRTGFPEVVYCEGKTPRQIRDIFAELAKHGTVMGTRATERDYAAVKQKLPDAEYHEAARIIVSKSSFTVPFRCHFLLFTDPVSAACSQMERRQRCGKEPISRST